MGQPGGGSDIAEEGTVGELDTIARGNVQCSRPPPMPIYLTFPPNALLHNADTLLPCSKRCSAPPSLLLQPVLLPRLSLCSGKPWDPTDEAKPEPRRAKSPLTFVPLKRYGPLSPLFHLLSDDGLVTLS